VTIVACLLMAGGLLSAISVTYGFAPGHAVRFDFNVVELFLGFGLVIRSRWALRFTGMWVVLNILLAVLMLFLLAFGPTPMSTTAKFPLNLFFPSGTGVTRTFAVAVVAGAFALYLWEYRVLVRDDVRALFADSAQRAVRL
jgi:hypothetical protein